MTQLQNVQEALDNLYAFAKQEMQTGKSAQEVESALMERGLDLGTAVAIVHDVETGLNPSITTRGNGRGKAVMGGIICLIGILVTVGSYSAAQGGGTYVIAWGAILFGAIEMFRGLAEG